MSKFLSDLAMALAIWGGLSLTFGAAWASVRGWQKHKSRLFNRHYASIEAMLRDRAEGS